MSSRGTIDWKRLAAMLCIALAAVFTLDLASAAAAPCESPGCSAACDMGACEDHDNGSPCAQHDCCHGTVATESSVGEAILVNVPLSSGVSWREASADSGCLDTLERPPKPSSVA